MSRPVLCNTLIGRDDELDHLSARRKATGDRHGGLVVVTGEPGIGKSRLLSEFQRSLTGGSARVARVECREFAQDPLGPIDDIIATLNRDEGARRTYATASEHLTSILDSFEAHADRRLTIAIVEDIHWADVTLVRALAVLAARAARHRLLVIATARDNEIAPSHPNFIAFGKLLREPSVSRIALAPLGHSDIRALLDTALAGRIDLPSLVLEDVGRRSEGNPLFAEELLRAVVDRHADGRARESDVVPISLHAIVRERVEECSDDERAFIRAASLCGRRFDLDVIERVVGVGGDRSAQLRRLCGLQLIVPIAGRPREYAFRHAMTRDALYGELLPSEAQPLHEKIALALLESPNAAAYVTEIAHHYWQSIRRTAGAEYYEAAARHARKTLAYAEAIRWYERAIDTCGYDRSDVARVRLELARTLAAADQPVEALQMYGDIVQRALECGDIDVFVRARKLMGGLLANDGRREEAISLLEATLESIHDMALSSKLDLVLRITNYHLLKQSTDDARTSLARIDLASLDATSSTAAEYFLLRAQLHARESRPDAWTRDFESALAIFEGTPNAGPFVRFAHVIYAWQAWSTGRLAASTTHLERALATSAESAALNTDVPLGMALTEFHSGRLAGAQRWLNKVRPSSDLMSRKLRAGIGVEIGAATGDASIIASYLDLSIIDDCVRANDAYGTIRTCCSFGAGLVALGRDREASALFERAASAIDSSYEFVPAILTIAAHRPDRIARARAALERDAVDAENRFARAALDLIDAEGLVEKNRAEAERLASNALAIFDDLGWRLLVARANEIVAPHLALEQYRDCGHVAAVRRLRRNIEPTRDRDAAVAVLTARQREVARLVAARNGNRAIAATLSVSEKTVEKHLSAVYEKLAFESRADLIEYFAAQSAV